MEDIQVLRWIQDALHKDSQQAYGFLLKYYWNDVYGYIFSKVREVDTVEDLTIRTFTRAFRKLHLYSPEFRFKTWVITIANNMVKDHFKKCSRSIVVEHDRVVVAAGHEMSAEELLAREQQKEYIRLLIGKLKVNYRGVIELRYLKELSYNEISEELGISLDNVKVRILRAKKILCEWIVKDKKKTMIYHCV